MTIPWNVFLFHSDAVPTIPELLNFNVGDDETVNIPREIGPNYLNFGAQLLLDKTLAHINDLERKYQKDGADINAHILNEWLDGKGRKPISWATLVKVLDIIKKKELAATLNTFLSNQS